MKKKNVGLDSLSLHDGNNQLCLNFEPSAPYLLGTSEVKNEG